MYKFSIEYLQYFFMVTLLVILHLQSLCQLLISFGHLRKYGHLIVLVICCLVALSVQELDIYFLISYLVWLLMWIIFSVANYRWKLYKFRDRINSYCVFFLVVLVNSGRCTKHIYVSNFMKSCLHKKLFNSCRLFRT